MSDSLVNDTRAMNNRQSLGREPTVRGQLLWASIFPLGIFILLSVLMIVAVFRQWTLALTLKQNTAFIQVAASKLSNSIPSEEVLSDLEDTIRPFLTGVSGSFYWVDQRGQVLFAMKAEDVSIPLGDILAEVDRTQESKSWLTQATSDEEVVVSYAPVMDGTGELILVEPLKVAMIPTRFYRAVLIALLVLGAFFSLCTLSLGIKQITHPINELIDHARQAVPGSIFRPMPERGPAELRTLIQAFNQMVVRLAKQQTSLRQYAHQALLSQEAERRRLSHELHDETMQDLIGLVQRVELCRTEIERDPLLARRRLDELQVLLENTLGNVRRISNALRPSILEDLGLPAALHALCDDIERQMSSLHCSFTFTGPQRRLMPDLELAIFRVVQESLSNIRKHAHQATFVNVELVFRQAEIEVLVRNNGPIFSSPDIRDLVRNGHLGLAGMYERARLFHGELTITSDPVAGTVVRLCLPYPADSMSTDLPS